MVIMAEHDGVDGVDGATKETHYQLTLNTVRNNVRFIYPEI